MTKRTDVHRPSAINPADYEFDSVDYLWHSYSTCDHCGHAIRWVAHFNYTPSGEAVVFGHVCAKIIGAANDRMEYELNQLRKRVQNQKKKIMYAKEWQARRDEMERQFPDVIEFMENINPEIEKDYFLRSMAASMEQWGSLTPRQTEAVQRTMQKRVEAARKALEREAEPQPETPAPVGKVTVQGEIVSTKWFSTIYGDTLKMMVKLPDQNKVWGTVPKAIRAKLDDNLKGATITFSATFTASNDEHFSYFNRPTQAGVISPA